MSRLAQILFLYATIGFAFLFGFMVIVGGLRWSDIRDILLHDAYRSFTVDGDRIPGMSPGIVARLVIRSLSEPDDARLRLVPEVRLREPRRLAPVFDRLAIAEAELVDAARFRAR